MADVKRRKFITLLGGAAAGWPVAARVQPPAMPVIGFRNGASSSTFADNVATLRLGLKESGFIEGQNIAVEYRWADPVYDRPPALAADLVRRRVAVVEATGAAGDSDLAVRLATPTTLFVFLTKQSHPPGPAIILFHGRSTSG